MKNELNVEQVWDRHFCAAPQASSRRGDWGLLMPSSGCSSSRASSCRHKQSLSCGPAGSPRDWVPTLTPWVGWSGARTTGWARRLLGAKAMGPTKPTAPGLRQACAPSCCPGSGTSLSLHDSTGLRQCSGSGAEPLRTPWCHRHTGLNIPSLSWLSWPVLGGIQGTPKLRHSGAPAGMCSSPPCARWGCRAVSRKEKSGSKPWLQRPLWQDVPSNLGGRC